MFNVMPVMQCVARIHLHAAAETEMHKNYLARRK